MAKPHLLMIGGWTDIFNKAFALGYEVSYLGSCAPSSALDSQILQKCRNVQEVQADHVGICLSFARTWHAQTPFSAVVSFTELGMETAAVIADALKLAGLELWPVVVTRYKDWMRKQLAGDLTLVLPWKKLENIEHLQAFYQEFGPEVIVKPISGAASVGVQQIHSQQELQAYCKQHAQLGAGQFIVEQFIKSNQTYSVEALSSDKKHHVLTMSSSQNVGYPYTLVNHTIVPPHDLNEAQYQTISDTVVRFLDAIGLRNGVTHTEVKLDSAGKAWIVESQTRVGGDRIWQMAEMTSGVPQIDLALQNLIGQIEVPAPQKKGVAGFFCLLPPAGDVVAVAECGFLSGLDYVLEHSINIQVGQRLEKITNNTERRGYLLVHAPSHPELFARVEQIFNQIRVEYKDGAIWQPRIE